MLSYLPFDKTAKKLCRIVSAFIYAFCPPSSRISTSRLGASISNEKKP